jgi:AcrR family transcriptional regulator
MIRSEMHAGRDPRGAAGPVIEYEDPMERILAAAFRVVARDTISGTRMPAIAKEVNLSQGALHYYWESKENLLVNLLAWLLAAFREGRGITTGQKLPPAPPGDLEAGRKRQLDFLRLLITDEPEMTRVYYDFWVQAASSSGPLNEAMKAQFDGYREELKRTMLPDSPQADVLAGVVVGMLEGPAIQLLIDRSAFDLDAYVALVDGLITSLVAADQAG